MRTPPEKRDDRFHFLLQSALSHLGPINVFGVVILAMVANAVGYTPNRLVFGVLVFGLTFVVVAMVFLGAAYAVVSDARRSVRVLRTAANVLTLPVYWFLQWGADVRALAQFYIGRSHWEKTTHHGRNNRDDEYLPDRSIPAVESVAGPEIVFSVTMDEGARNPSEGREATESLDGDVVFRGSFIDRED